MPDLQFQPGRGTLHILQQGGTNLAFALRQPKIIIILNFQPPKIMTQKSLGSKIRDSNSHLMIFFQIVTEKNGFHKATNLVFRNDLVMFPLSTCVPLSY